VIGDEITVLWSSCNAELCIMHNLVHDEGWHYRIITVNLYFSLRLTCFRICHHEDVEWIGLNNVLDFAGVS
jgi:hypothetical protein